MDVDLLISEIFLRAPLWDQKDKNHHNRFTLEKLWNEVAVKFNTTPAAVRNKWKSLRDKFRTTLASIPKPKSGYPQLSDYAGEWKYFKSLSFLMDQFTSKKSSGNFIENDNLSLDDNENDCYIRNCESLLEEQIGSPLEISSTPSSSRPSSATGHKSEALSSRKRSMGDALLQIKKEKLQFLQEKRIKREEDDEDLNFFKSLLPHVRSLSAYEKMEYRIGVMKITQQFMKPA